jgi:hypothetical protein
VSVYLERTGSGMAAYAAMVPDFVRGAVVARADDELGVITKAALRRGAEEDEIGKKHHLGDQIVGAIAGGAASHFLGEASSFIDTAEAGINTAGVLEFIGHKYVERPVLKGINKVKHMFTARREKKSLDEATKAALHAAGTVEPRDLNIDGKAVKDGIINTGESISPGSAVKEMTKFHDDARKRGRRWVDSRSDVSTRPDDDRPPAGPGNHRSRRKERRAARISSERHMRRDAKNNTLQESYVKASNA